MPSVPFADCISFHPASPALTTFETGHCFCYWDSNHKEEDCSIYCWPTCQNLPLGHLQHLYPWAHAISAKDGSILASTAPSVLVELVMLGDMSLLTVCLITIPLRKHILSIEDTTTKTRGFECPPWINCSKKRIICIESGAQMYKGGNVTIQFLCHTFFLLSITQCSYPFPIPSHEMTNRYLHVLGLHVVSFFYLWHSIRLSSPLATSLIVVMCH